MLCTWSRAACRSRAAVSAPTRLNAPCDAFVQAAQAQAAPRKRCAAGRLQADPPEPAARRAANADISARHKNNAGGQEHLSESECQKGSPAGRKLERRQTEYIRPTDWGGGLT